MNSTVRVVDVDSGEERTVTLVYPADSGEQADEVSVTDPLGVALLGSDVGDMVQSLDDATTQHLRVAELLYQPERAW
jgi:regulator of nucleoside diphosphate kinase